MKLEIEKLELLDLNNEEAIKEFTKLSELFLEPYKESKGTSLALAQDNKALITKNKNKICKFFKEKRDYFNKMSKKIISIEKTITEPFSVLEEEYKKHCEELYNEQIKQDRIKLLPARQAIISNSGLQSVDEEVLLQLNEEEFSNLVANQIREIEEKEQKEKEIQERIKKAEIETEERIKRQAEEARLMEEKRIEQDKIKKLEEEQKTLKNQKVQEWLAKNGCYDENNPAFKVVDRDSQLFLYKIVGVLVLEG